MNWQIVDILLRLNPEKTFHSGKKKQIECVEEEIKKLKLKTFAIYSQTLYAFIWTTTDTANTNRHNYYLFFNSESNKWVLMLLKQWSIVASWILHLKEYTLGPRKSFSAIIYGETQWYSLSLFTISTATIDANGLFFTLH